MGATDEIEPVYLAELVGYLGAKEPASSTWRNRPRVNILRIRPDQVAEGTLARNLLVSLDQAYLVEGLDLGREAAVHAQDRVVNESRNGHIVEQVAANTPRVRIAVLGHALIVKSVDLSDLTRFVVASQEHNAIRVFGLEVEVFGVKKNALGMCV